LAGQGQAICRTPRTPVWPVLLYLLQLVTANRCCCIYYSL
jgi:hypothetical protein